MYLQKLSTTSIKRPETTQSTLSKPINLNGRTVGAQEVIKQKCFKCHERELISMF